MTKDVKPFLIYRILHLKKLDTMDFKGTKGDWKITKTEGLRICINENSIDVWWGLSNPTETKEQAIANAKLIIAAPDLLEALILVKNELYMAIECINGTPTAKLSTNIAAAEKAINKALN